jgi:hypothetical protein
MRAWLRRVAIAVIVTSITVTTIGQGLAEPDPASVVRIELSEYAFSQWRTSRSSSSGGPASTESPVIATKKGVNLLERGRQVHFMAEFPAGA